jgi:hypothetical protein
LLSFAACMTRPASVMRRIAALKDSMAFSGSAFL